MAKKKEIKEIEPIDFDLVFEEIREKNEEIKLSNIFELMNYSVQPQQFVTADCWEDRNKYQQYIIWLRQQGYSEWSFR